MIHYGDRTNLSEAPLKKKNIHCHLFIYFIIIFNNPHSTEMFKNKHYFQTHLYKNQPSQKKKKKKCTLCVMEATAFSISKIVIRCKQYLGFWVKLEQNLQYTAELQSIFTNNLKYRFHITVEFWSFKWLLVLKKGISY